MQHCHCQRLVFCFKGLGSRSYRIAGAMRMRLWLLSKQYISSHIYVVSKSQSALL
jgi:hypothetical protein